MPLATTLDNPAPAQPETARSGNAGAVGAEVQVIHPRRFFAALLCRSPKTGRGYPDPLFERPDLVEDDYSRFRHQLGR